MAANTRYISIAKRENARRRKIGRTLLVTYRALLFEGNDEESDEDGRDAIADICHYLELKGMDVRHELDAAYDHYYTESQDANATPEAP
jgi:hypothetical protein